MSEGGNPFTEYALNHALFMHITRHHEIAATCLVIRECKRSMPHLKRRPRYPFPSFDEFEKHRAMKYARTESPANL